MALKTFFKTGIASVLALGFVMFALGAPAKAGIEITGVTGRAPIIDGRPGVAYFTIRNTGSKADHLLEIQSPAIGRIEIHESKMEGDMMTMEPVSSLEIPAGGEVVFKPGSYHAMLFDMNEKALKKHSAPLIFTFEKAGKITVSAKILAPGGK